MKSFLKIKDASSWDFSPPESPGMGSGRGLIEGVSAEFCLWPPPCPSLQRASPSTLCSKAKSRLLHTSPSRVPVISQFPEHAAWTSASPMVPVVHFSPFSGLCFSFSDLWLGAGVFIHRQAQNAPSGRSACVLCSSHAVRVCTLCRLILGSLILCPEALYSAILTTQVSVPRIFKPFSSS